MSQPSGPCRLRGHDELGTDLGVDHRRQQGTWFEAARRLGKQGWTILLGSRDESRGRAAANKLTDGGANVVVVPLEVTSDESVTDAVRLVREHTDRLDVLINNAGVPGRGITPADATVGEIYSVYDTNVYGPIRVTYAFRPLLQAADHPRVVMVKSLTANSPPPT